MAHIHEIARLHATGELVVCVGPDLSAAGGLATPLQLARRLAGRLLELDPHTDISELDALINAGHDDHALGLLRHRLGAEDFVHRVCGVLDEFIDEPPELARLIAGVAPGLHAVYTTNLDRLLERAFDGRWWVTAQAAANLAQRRHVIVKLCGTIGRSETWVLTARDYLRTFGGHDERRATFEAVYRNHRILFLGFDEGLAILHRLLAAVGPALANEEPPNHFLATDLGRHADDSQHELEARGLQLVSIGAVRELLRELDTEKSGDEADAWQSRFDRPTPYPGLRPYTSAFADFFFGRDEELALAIETLAGPKRWLSVEGPSGVGKSSFVRAGVIRALAQGQLVSGPAHWNVLVMRPGKQPLLDFATELRRLFHLDDVESVMQALHDEHALSDILRSRMPPQEGLLVVVDQLEELLTFSDPTQRDAFANAVAEAIADDGIPLLLVTTLRSDFVGEFASQEHTLARTFDTLAERQILRAMSEADLREVIVRPARMLGVEFEHRLPERILQDAVHTHSGPSQATLPLVAHILRGLWDDGAERERLTLEAYERLGGISGAITRSADLVLDGLSRRARDQAREVLLMLVNVDGDGRDTRRTRTREEVLEKAGGGEEGRRLLMRLSGQVRENAVVRLISFEDGAAARVDLVHEALAHEWTTMRGWLDERRSELVGRADLARNVRRWSDQGRPWRALPGGPELKWMLKVRAENAEQRRYQRALRWIRGARLVMLTAGLAFVLSGPASFGLYVRSRARMESALEWGEYIAFRLAIDMKHLPGVELQRWELLVQTRQLLEELADHDPRNASVLRVRVLENIARGDLARANHDLTSARDAYDEALIWAHELVATDPTSAEAIGFRDAVERLTRSIDPS